MSACCLPVMLNLMQQNKHTACCTLYKNKRAHSSSLFRGLFSVRSCCLFFFQAASWCGVVCMCVYTYMYVCVRVCVCVCSLPRGRWLGACNAWLCSPVRHGRRIASIAAAARRMRRRNSSIGAPRGDPSPLGAARRQEGRQQGGRWFKVPLSKAANPQRLRMNTGDCCCDPFLYLRLQL